MKEAATNLSIRMGEITMPYQIIRGDITNLPTHIDAIVNTAHPNPKHGLGTDAAIFKKAGPKLQACREQIGRIREGSASVTPAFNLNAKIIIHTVAPVWRGGRYGEEEILRKCYVESLKQLKQHNLHSVAFPLIGSGNLGFPRPIALKIAISAFMDFCLQHEIEIFLVLFDQTSFEYGEKVFGKIPALIDSNQAIQTSQTEYCWEDGVFVPTEKSHLAIRTSREQRTARKDAIDDIFRNHPYTNFSGILNEIMKTLDIGNADVYNSGSISSAAFRKYLGGSNPGKPMALAISIALMLDLEQTKKLIARAGHILNPDNSWDCIIINAIEAQTYSVPQINRMLAEKGQKPLLGSNTN